MIVSNLYFSALSPTGQRQDHAHRPELLHGTIDLLVSKPYWALQPTTTFESADGGPNISAATDALTTTASDLLGGLTASLGPSPNATRAPSPMSYKEKEAEKKKEEQRLRKPSPLSRVFVLDLSESGTRRGVVKCVCESIRKGLYGSKRKEEVNGTVEGEAEAEEDEEEVIGRGERIGIITVGETVGFWDLSVS